MRARNTLRLFLVLLVTIGTGIAGAVNIGPDDRQVSFTGLAGTTESDAFSPALAFDSVHQRYLTVWSADEDDGDFRILGQLLTGASGAAIGGPFAISPIGLPNSDHRQPAIAFDPTRQQYLVIWSGDGIDPGAYEIMGQIVGSDGQLVGVARRYSDMGLVDTDTAFDAVTPDLAWHGGLGAYVLAWAGDDDTGDLADGRFEIYGQLVDGATGAESGANDFRISFAGPDADGNDATNPSVAVTTDPQRWFVAFEGDVIDEGVHDPEIWMYGCSGDAPDSLANPLSLMGGGFDDGLSARNPDLAWVPSSSELICVWDGEAGGGTRRSIYGQRITPDGVIAGAMISFSGIIPGPGAPFREAIEPAIAIDPVSDEWFITWRGDLDDMLIHFDHEIWGARFNDIGAPVDWVLTRLSNMDPALGPVAGAGAPALAINSLHGYKMIVWSGDLASTPGGENEIFAQGWSDDAASAVDTPTTPTAFALHGAAPNPFNPMTKIAFDLPTAEPVSLQIYDAAGRLVRTLLADAPGQPGRNDVVWNGRDDQGQQVASGVYLYRVTTPSQRGLGRMTLLK